MSGGVNKAILLGYLGGDPEIRYLPRTGDPMMSVYLATNSFWRDKSTGEKKKRTEWHRLVAWGKTGENMAQYLTKGTKVYVEGEIRYRSWTDPKTEQEKWITEIMVQSWHGCWGPRGEPRQEQMPLDPPKDDFKTEDYDDDIPF